MTLTTRTRQYFILAALTAAAAVTAAVYLLVQIRGQGMQLEANIAAITESARRVESLARIARMISETEQQRAAIDTVFFDEESDSLAFLTKIETLAPELGLTFKNLSIGRVPQDPAVPLGNGEVVFKVEYVGTKSEVMEFTRLLESLPYHSRLENLTISNDSEGWKGEAEVRVTILTS